MIFYGTEIVRKEADHASKANREFRSADLMVSDGKFPLLKHDDSLPRSVTFVSTYVLTE